MFTKRGFDDAMVRTLKICHLVFSCLAIFLLLRMN